MSRFRVANGMEAEVTHAFRHRPRLVDAIVGFLGMEVYTDRDDGSVYHLVTRWTDWSSYHEWHRSDAHHASHMGIPRGLKLDAAFTRVSVMQRLPEGAGVDGWEQDVADSAPLLASVLEASEHVPFAVVSADGTIRRCSPAFARVSGGAPARSLWSLISDEDAAMLRALRDGTTSRRDICLHFSGSPLGMTPGHPFAVAAHPDRFVLVAV